MLFNSLLFILVYLPVVLAGFFAIGRKNAALAAGWLMLSSLFFYGWWNPKFVLLLLASAMFNFGIGYWMARSKGAMRGRLLSVAVGADLLVLGIFKYLKFFIDNINQMGGNVTLVSIVLPLGISFFTFTQIAFLVDTYRGLVREFNVIHYLLFITWFPHLIAGPVLHHKQMMPQFSLPETYRPNAESFSVGLTLFAFGLFKKVILADQISLYANPVFDTAGHGGPVLFSAAWAGALAYTLQLYFDFSGYSDMAIGLSRMFNVKLPLNFDSPYKSANIIEFWRRWHTTLSQFLRDYLYFPLGGNRRGAISTL